MATSIFDGPNASDRDEDEEPEAPTRGCPRDADGFFAGVRCEPYIPCYYAKKYERADAGCGRCYVHCLCQPDTE